MTFRKGESGNAAGRPKGVSNERTQLAKLFEPHAPDLIAKAVELAIGGDVQALRLFFDKIIPRAEHALIEIELPVEINRTNLPEVNALILTAVIDGRLSIGEAERLLVLITKLLADLLSKIKRLMYQ